MERDGKFKNKSFKGWSIKGSQLWWKEVYRRNDLVMKTQTDKENLGELTGIRLVWCRLLILRVSDVPEIVTDRKDC